MSMIEIVVPVYNEEKDLAKNIPRLYNFLQEYFNNFIVTIADNASIDKTPQVSKYLINKYKKINYVRLEKKGRGGALRKVWLESNSEYLIYMDVDLSVELEALPRIVDLLKTYDVVYGSRFESDSFVKRRLFREALSRGYLFLVKILLNTHINDLQCGFKGIRNKAAKELIPLVKNNSWFFDTELLILAEKLYYRISPVSITWIEDHDSRVNIKKTIYEYLKEVLRMRRELKKLKNNIDP